MVIQSKIIEERLSWRGLQTPINKTVYSVKLIVDSINEINNIYFVY